MTCIVFTLALIAATMATANSLHCYTMNEYQSHPITTTNNIACLSVFEVEGQSSSFGAIVDSQFNAHRKIELATADGSCKKMEKILYDKTQPDIFYEAFLCYCTEDKCNKPITYAQFAQNGYKMPSEF
ncbi:Protein sleepless [Caenorhabditis elegans]|uniref:Protein sleepless n=1 Tax=Caenorhabditis elegans TaxID=6239 RepID=Q17924_CAEEL|nr:Protein sleepless [Caenorhabditis elegans]CCD64273.1 Protein sleepless [Caenorhabditis elegans]|eukprot:NP_504984.1 Uncharacterized protein CELE_C12D5.5 [Caenorhabditis elegans]